MIFTGHTQLTIDAKHRLQIPAKHRALLVPDRDGDAFYCVPWHDHKILLFTQARFHALAEKSAASLAPASEESAGQANYFGLAERSEIDSAGRISLTKLHLDLTQIGTEVIVVGAGPRLEVWNAVSWHKDLAERFQKLPEMMRNLERPSR